MSNEPFLPYGRQTIDAADIQSVVDALNSDWLTTGPNVSGFENAVCEYTGAKYAVAVSNGTAALHAAMNAIGIQKGDEVIVPAITFAATSNSVLYCGGTPVFADCVAENLLISPESIETLITPKTKAIIAVDYAGCPCDWNELRRIATKYHLMLVADSCHAIGAEYKGRCVGTLADITVFSFHPVKHITTGEGGMAVTDSEELAESMRIFRSHGITTDARQRESSNAWYYEMTELGYNYRITDIQCALGLSQLSKLSKWIGRRNEIAKSYNEQLLSKNAVPLSTPDGYLNAYHLYVVRVPDRDVLFEKMRAHNIGVNVHYIPVYLHPYYQKLGYKKGLCPTAEAAYKEILSLPMWPGMCFEDTSRVVGLM